MPPGATAGGLRLRIDMARDPSRIAGRLLLIEAIVAVAFLGLGVAFFLIPVATPPFLPSWWVGFLLVILFFTIVFVDSFRRRARQHAELQRALHERGPDAPEAARHDPHGG